MKRQLSDEQLDNLMRTLMNAASADDGTINDIADSPVIWWGVQRQINAEKDTARLPWPPANIMRRWLMIGVTATAAIVLAISFFLMQPDETSTLQAEISTPLMNSESVLLPGTGVNGEQPLVAAKNEARREQTIKTRHTREVAAVERTHLRSVTTTSASTKKASEIKTDFIALSYARNPESGQIVRVKVPSSMMVTLGLVAAVEKPSALIDAEVVVGDDGLTRAIRFIR